MDGSRGPQALRLPGCRFLREGVPLGGAALQLVVEGAARAEGEHEQRLARHVVHDVRVAIDLHTDNSRVRFGDKRAMAL